MNGPGLSKTAHVSDGDFYGDPTIVLENPHVRLGTLRESAPRIVRLNCAGSSQNVFAETPTVGWDTPYGWFRPCGGHRLWRAPQAIAGSDAPDRRVQVSVRENVLEIDAEKSAAGDTRRIVVSLDEAQPRITVRHELRNDSAQLVWWAPWAITQLRLNGLAIVPLKEPEPLSNSAVPNRNIVLWPQAVMSDERFTVSDDCIWVRATPGALTKIGTYCEIGRVGYYNDGILFRKTFSAQPPAEYPDLGCNVQVFVDPNCLELESLGPITALASGESATHTEVWDLTRFDAPPNDPAAALRTRSWIRGRQLYAHRDD